MGKKEKKGKERKKGQRIVIGRNEGGRERGRLEGGVDLGNKMFLEGELGGGDNGRVGERTPPQILEHGCADEAEGSHTAQQQLPSESSFLSSL